MVNAAAAKAHGLSPLLGPDAAPAMIMSGLSAQALPLAAGAQAGIGCTKWAARVA